MSTAKTGVYESISHNTLTYAIQFLLFGALIFFFTCTRYEKMHVQYWQGAFFINDTTLGVLGWEWDENTAQNIFTETEYFNYCQLFFTYNINSKQLTQICTLQADCGTELPYNNLAYHHPWLYYSTCTNRLETGVLNIETLEKSLLNTAGAYKRAIPLIVSTHGNYLGYQQFYDPDYKFGVYDLKNNQDTIGFSRSRPVYIDDSLNKIILIDDDSIPMWFLSYDIATGKIDTLGENDTGRIDHVINNKIIVQNAFDGDSLNYLNGADLLQGTFTFLDLPDLHVNTKDSYDINLEKGLCAHNSSRTYNYYLTDYKNNKVTETILLYTKKKR